MPLTLEPGKQRQMDLYEFEASKFRAREGNTGRTFPKTKKTNIPQNNKTETTPKPICKNNVPSMLTAFAEGIGCAKVFLLGCCVLVC